jgi:RHS repeat-associated protein
LGNGHAEVDGYDTRGRLQTIAYNNTSQQAVYSASLSRAPDGSITSANDSANGAWNYTYDEFNRLLSGSATSGQFSGLSLGWSYDRYGNRVSQTATGSYQGGVYQGTFTFASNQIGGYCYDAAGNLLDTQTCAQAGSNHLYTYDAEGRLIATAGMQYEYNAAGERVSKDNASGVPQNLYLHDGAGNQIAELNASLAVQHVNVYTGSHLIGTLESDGVHYAYSDWLGTKRYEAGPTGGYLNSWASLPFGDSLTQQVQFGPDATEQHFTGKEHDAESGLDYFGARYYQSQTGRWLLPDWSAVSVPVPYAVFTNPQSLNLYTYVGNNPVNVIDADGHTGDGNTTTAAPWSAAAKCELDELADGCGGIPVVDDASLSNPTNQVKATLQAQQLSAETLRALGLSTDLHVTAQEVVAGVLAQEFRGEGTDAAQAGAVTVLNRTLHDLANDDKASQWGRGGVSQQGLSNADNAMLKIISAPNQFKALEINPGNISKILAGKQSSPEYGAALGKLRSVSIGAPSLGNFGRVGNTDIGRRENFGANWSGRTRHSGILVNHTEFY